MGGAIHADGSHPWKPFKQGNRLPWKNYQDYIRDFIGLRLGSLRDKELEFS